MTYQQIITGILDIIGYTEDKEMAADQMVAYASLEAVYELADTLPKEQKDQLDDVLARAQDDPERAAHQVHKYFTKAQIREASDKATIRAIGALIEAVEKDLNDEHKEKIAALVERADSESANTH